MQDRKFNQSSLPDISMDQSAVMYQEERKGHKHSAWESLLVTSADLNLAYIPWSDYPDCLQWHLLYMGISEILDPAVKIKAGKLMMCR